MNDYECVIWMAYRLRQEWCLCRDEFEHVCETTMSRWTNDSQRNMRSVCWRPLIASNTASLATSSIASVSFSGVEGGRKLNFAAQDNVRALGWPRHALIGNGEARRWDGSGDV
jgi:hypothetical protein